LKMEACHDDDICDDDICDDQYCTRRA